MEVLDFFNKIEKANQHLPILMIMNLEGKNIVEEAMEHGVRGFVSKSEGYLRRVPLVVQKTLREYRLRNEVERW
ncbi:MAG: response regulator [Planctomycetes bacterium]|nr:response regulator [Planctomycetota bacterium]